MRTILSGLVALICACVFSQAATAQTVPDSPTVSPILRGATNILGAAPPPPILRKLSAASMLAAESTNGSEQPHALAAPEVSDEDIVRVSTSLITVPAQVMDRNGRFIGSLRQDDFVIYENGVEQQLSYFGSVEQPFTVALLLDVSGSTQTRLQAIRAAANAFIARLRPNDRLLLISFDGKINVLTEAVTVSQLRKVRLRLDAVNDGTLLYDTVDTVLNQRLASIPGRKAVVLLTDGVDQGSTRGSRKKNLHDADESDVMIYTVQYNTLPQLPERLGQIVDPKIRARVQVKMEKEYAIGAGYLRTLADETGGRLYNADTLVDIQQSFGAIMDELGRQYSLGYYPKGQVHAGEKRDIKVRVRVPNLVVRARDSYIATATPPGENGKN
ncbi:MAG: von Willebrand factor type domain protein [Acidobacteria bacterium]|nr:von Willebrand factor type domain protein [Acidobacteriota bacterium]